MTPQRKLEAALYARWLFQQGIPPDIAAAAVAGRFADLGSLEAQMSVTRAADMVRAAGDVAQLGPNQDIGSVGLPDFGGPPIVTADVVVVGVRSGEETIYRTLRLKLPARISLSEYQARASAASQHLIKNVSPGGEVIEVSFRLNSIWIGV